MKATTAKGAGQADRRTQILNAAFAQLVAHGFEGLRVRAVADVVGINQATLLYHFPDKSALVSALVELIVGRFRALGNERIGGHGARHKLLPQYLTTLRDFYGTAPEVFIALNEISVRASRDPQIADALLLSIEYWLAFVRTVIRHDYPGASDDVVERRAQLLITFCKGLGLRSGEQGLLAALLRRDRASKAALKRVTAEIATFETEFLPQETVMKTPWNTAARQNAIAVNALSRGQLSRVHVDHSERFDCRMP